MPAILKPALGAGLTGLVALVFFWWMDFDQRTLAVLATGYGVLQQSLNPTGPSGIPAVPAVLLFSIAIMKILTTSLTIGSGGSGGVFGPSMVIGGCVGAAFGQTLHHLFPTLAADPQVYAIVGMAGFFAGCAHAPLSTIIMVSEMTGSYKLLLPSMWVCMLCFLFGRRWSLYSKQVPSRLESPAHRGDFLFDVLEGLRVSNVPLKERLTIQESMTLEDITHLIPETRQNYFPVVDIDGGLVGVFSTDDIRSYLYDETLWRLAVARDVMSTQLLTVTPEDDLDTAMRQFTQLNLDELPVVEAHNPRRLKGMLRRKDVIAVYNRRVLEQRLAVKAEESA
jgi:chloride channel protein, CIC family